MNARFKYALQRHGIDNSTLPSGGGLLLSAHVIGFLLGGFLIFWGWRGLMLVLAITIFIPAGQAFAAPSIEQRKVLADAYQCSLAFKIKGRRAGDEEISEMGEQLELQIRRAYKATGASSDEVNTAMKRYADLVDRFPDQRVNNAFDTCKPDMRDLYWRVLGIAEGKS